MLFSLFFNNSLTFAEILLYVVVTIVVIMISLTVHEYAHGFMAVKMGDSTPKTMGRLTLNPLRHIDLMGMLSFILFGIGWAKPMPINPLNFKRYKKGMRLVSLAGVLSNFLLGLLAAIIYAILLATVGYSTGPMMYVYMILSYFMLINSCLVLFNILPIPPFDGFNFLATFFKQDNKFLNFMYRNGMKIFWGIILVSLIVEIFTGVDILSVYLSLINDFVYVPIALLGV